MSRDRLLSSVFFWNTNSQAEQISLAVVDFTHFKRKRKVQNVQNWTLMLFLVPVFLLLQRTSWNTGDLIQYQVLDGYVNPQLTTTGDGGAASVIFRGCLPRLPRLPPPPPWNIKEQLVPLATTGGREACVQPLPIWLTTFLLKYRHFDLNHRDMPWIFELYTELRFCT